MKASTRQTTEVEITFIEDDVLCPLCDSYDVEEGAFRFTCCCCGTEWKILMLEK